MFRPLLSLVAALALILAGVATAAATEHGPVTEMVICGGGGPQTIRLDAQGNPVKGDQCCDCMQCLVMAAALMTEPARGAVPAGLSQAKLPLAALPAPEPTRFTRPVPRGPPAITPAKCPPGSRPGLLPAVIEFGQVRHGKVVAASGQPTQVAR